MIFAPSRLLDQVLLPHFLDLEIKCLISSAYNSMPIFELLAEDEHTLHKASPITVSNPRNY